VLLQAYLEQLMSRTTAGKSTHTTPGFWYTDTLDLDTLAKGTGGSAVDKKSGFMRRQARVEESKAVFFSTPLHCDLFHTSKVLPPGVNMSVKLFRQGDAFGIMSAAGGEFVVEFKSLTLSVRKLQATDDLLHAHARLWLKRDVVLPMIRGNITTHVVNTGLSSVVFQNVASGVLPKQMLCGFVTSAAFEGTVEKNPFKFNHHSVKNLCFMVNGERHPPSSYELDFDKGKYTQLYQDLVDKFGITEADEALPFDLEDFKSDYCLYPLSLSPDNCSMYHAHGELTGTIDIHVSFDAPVPTTLQLIVYHAKTNRLTIDADRNVKIDVV